MKTDNKTKDLTVRYALIQSFFWMSLAAVIGYISFFLLDSGYSNTQIGLVTAIAGALSAVLQPAVASYADRPGSASLKKILLILAVILLAVSILLLLAFHRNMIMTGLAYGLILMLLQSLIPLVNSLGITSLNQGQKLNYGIARGMGSVSYALCAYLLGILTEKTGAFSVPLAMMLLLLFLIGSLFLFPFENTGCEKPEKASASCGSIFSLFIKYKKFSIVLVGWTLIYISHVLLNNFAYQIVNSKNGGSAEMGVAMALAAMAEFPTLFLFNRMLKRARCDVWFRMSGIFFMLKSLCSLLAPNITVFYAVQLFQMFGWALVTVSSVYYVNAIVEEGDAIKGQAYMTMTYTLGTVAGALIGGALIDRSGVNSMLIFSTTAALIGAIIVFLAAERTESV